jgi:hypothetical protein
MGGFNFGGGFGALFGHGATNALTRANNRLSAINASTSNATRQISNEAAAAEGNLNRFVQSVNNNRALEAGGNAQEALIVNYLRGRDGQIAGNFSDDIRSAELAGHSAAAAALSGIDGNVVDMVNGSTALRDSIVRQSVEEHQDQQAYDVSRRAGNIASQMVAGLDNSIILDKLDYNVDYAKILPELSVKSQTMHGFFQGATWYNNGAAPDKDSAAKSTTSTEYDGFKTRERSSSRYDLADYAHDNKVDFKFKDPDTRSEKPSEYELWGSDASLNTQDTGSSFWSR